MGILLIVTFVNTSKSISYSDVAQSLVQLHDEPTEGLAKLNEVAESFADSHKNLDSDIKANQGMCERLEKMGNAVKAGLAARIKNAQGEIETLANQTEVNKKIIADSIAAEKAEVQKIKEAGAEIKKEATNLAKKEAELGETINVLERLKNIARDEMGGKTKINTEMGQYKVVNNHGVSFIQRTNLKQELHGLLAKSTTASKSLISTLIMIAANDDGHYSDPKIVAKIIAVLDKIINSNSLKRNNLRTDFEKESIIHREIIENASEMIQNLKEASIKASSRILMNQKETNMLNREITLIEGAQTRRTQRSQFKSDICAKQSHMMAHYQRVYAQNAKRVEELKAEISA